MARQFLIIIALLGLVGCAGLQQTPVELEGAEETAASKTISQLTPLAEAPAEGDQLVIDDSGLTKSITVLYLMRSLESTLTSYAVANDNLDVSVVKSGASCYFDGDGSALSANDQCRFRIPFKHTLNSVILTTDENLGTITIDVWIDEAGGSTGLDDVTDADSLFDTASEPTMDASSDQYVETVIFDSGEAVDIITNSYYIVNIDAVSTLTKVNVDFDFTRKE
jgi:hypothetical protein